MLLETTAVAPRAQPIAELSNKLQQLRRLESQPQAQPASTHLNAALQVARHGPVGSKADVSYIFIGIVVPTTPQQTN